MTPIGQIQTKATAYCTICNASTRRTLTALVYSREESALEQAKAEIREKAAKPYTCRVCKSIEKSITSYSYQTDK